MDVLKLNYKNGNMEIYVDKFFPCKQTQLKKIIRLMSSEDVRNLINKLQNMCGTYEEKIETNKKMYLANHQMAAEEQDMIVSGKWPNGVRLTKEEMWLRKDYFKMHEEHKKRHKKNILKYNRELETLKKNIETLVKHHESTV